MDVKILFELNKIMFNLRKATIFYPQQEIMTENDIDNQYQGKDFDFKNQEEVFLEKIQEYNKTLSLVFQNTFNPYLQELGLNIIDDPDKYAESATNWYLKIPGYKEKLKDILNSNDPYAINKFAEKHGQDYLKRTRNISFTSRGQKSIRHDMLNRKYLENKQIIDNEEILRTKLDGLVEEVLGERLLDKGKVDNFITRMIKIIRNRTGKMFMNEDKNIQLAYYKVLYNVMWKPDVVKNKIEETYRTLLRLNRKNNTQSRPRVPWLAKFNSNLFKISKIINKK